MATYPIWSAIDAATAHEIFLCAQQTQKKLYRSAVDGLAKYMHLRPALVLEMPKTERHAAWAQLLSHPQLEPMSFNFLCHWLIETKSDLLAAWLDALGIAHDGRGVVEELPEEPPRATIEKAIDTVLAKFDARTVSIYLRTFNNIDGAHWPVIEERIEKDPRLKLEPAASAAA